jgi:hypothetical protein
MGYHIPKDSIIIANYWSMCYDSDIFENPEEYSLERWIENPDLPVLSFGLGHRACPGKQFALTSIFIVMARILWAYRICAATDNEAKHNQMIAKGLTYGAEPLDALFEPRSLKHREVIEQEYGHMNKDPEEILSQIRAGFSSSCPNKKSNALSTIHIVSYRFRVTAFDSLPSSSLE